MAFAAELVRHGGALALLHSRSRTLLQVVGTQVVGTLLAILRERHGSRPLQQCKAIRPVVVPAEVGSHMTARRLLHSSIVAGAYPPTYSWQPRNELSSRGNLEVEEAEIEESSSHDTHLLRDVATSLKSLRRRDLGLRVAST